ncbi:unnamed protein product [Dibothriocephalus latus]|uniref:Uncharacterized protein n=1 Tax=Dibothriocephalus latus TaxID=60516 RepID=A0A3P6SNU5_DIBLA|nr:unnamed protein product [Dibothriocephalus latus]
MTRVLIDDRYRRLQKFKAKIEEDRRECFKIFRAFIAENLGKKISALTLLERGATFNAADASSAEFIAAFASALQPTKASEDKKDNPAQNIIAAYATQKA